MGSRHEATYVTDLLPRISFQPHPQGLFDPQLVQQVHPCNTSAGVARRSFLALPLHAQQEPHQQPRHEESTQGNDTERGARCSAIVVVVLRRARALARLAAASGHAHRGRFAPIAARQLRAGARRGEGAAACACLCRAQKRRLEVGKRVVLHNAHRAVTRERCRGGRTVVRRGHASRRGHTPCAGGRSTVVTLVQGCTVHALRKVVGSITVRPG